jgi:phenylpropionate dioxygenase-like ring-hydroxylating dioxygenase large terminal subunit
MDSMLILYPHDGFATHLTAAFPGSVPSYRHAYLFPNLFVSVTNGLVYFVSNLLPMAEDETLLHYRLFATPQLEALKPAVQQHLKEQAIKFTSTTLSEDKEILELCQMGMRGALGRYTLGAREHRIDQFHAAYLRWI